MPGRGKPFVKGDPRAGRPLGAKNGKTVELQDFLRTMASDPNYQESLRRRIESGRAPHVESLLARDRLGDPNQQHEIKGELIIRWLPAQSPK